MPALPTTKDVRRVRKQAEAGVTVTFDAVKSPLFAVLGAVDAASRTVTGAYSAFVERGEEVFDEFRSQPRVKRALDSVESGVDTAQERLEVVVSDLNFAATDLRSRFARASRSAGEKVARDTQRVANEASPRPPATRRVGDNNTPQS